MGSKLTQQRAEPRTEEAVGRTKDGLAQRGEGEPLVIMSRLGLSPDAFLLHLFLPGVFAAILCALVPLRRLGPRRYATHSTEGSRARERVFFLPWRIGAQLVGLLAVLRGLVPSLSLGGHHFFALLVLPLSRRLPRRSPTTCR